MSGEIYLRGKLSRGNVLHSKFETAVVAGATTSIPRPQRFRRQRNRQTNGQTNRQTDGHRVAFGAAA